MSLISLLCRRQGATSQRSRVQGLFVVLLLANLGIGLSAGLYAPEAAAQSRPKLADVNNRLERVEKVLDQSLLNMLQQIESLKLEIRGLRGEIEAQTYQIENLKKRNRDLYVDTDERIAGLEEKILLLMETVPVEGQPLSGPPLGSLPEGSEQEGLPSGEDNESGAGFNEDQVIDATASLSGSDRLESSVYVPTDETGNARRDVNQGAGVAVRATTDERLAYDNAYKLVVARQFDQAVNSFEQFLGRYPTGALADNAWYWQGEALYAKRQFDEAITNFTVVADSFPRSRKVPDARLKIAFSYYENGDYSQARLLLDQIRQDYPGRSAAVLARKRLLEMNQAGL